MLLLSLLLRDKLSLYQVFLLCIYEDLKIQLTKNDTWYDLKNIIIIIKEDNIDISSYKYEVPPTFYTTRYSFYNY